MLAFNHVSKTFESGFFTREKTYAVQDAHFTIRKGRTVGLAGNSGCGKTTIARMLLGAIAPNQGDICYQGDSILRASHQERKAYRREVQVVFQNPQGAMNPSQTIQTTLLEPMAIHHLYGGKDERMARIADLMNLLGLSPRLLDRYPHQISGGEAQRLVICRALTLSPKLLVLDEPTSMLDVSIQAHIMTLLQELKGELGLTYLYISHDLDLQRWFAQDLMVMHQGVIVEQGVTDTVLSHPQKAYTQDLVKAFWDF